MRAACCPHGPAITFERGGKKFLACSFSRDRSVCGFFHSPIDEEIPEAKAARWRLTAEEWLRVRRQDVDRRQEALRSLNQWPEEKRFFCITCARFFLKTPVESHPEHEISAGGNAGVELLEQLDASKTEAQFHFAPETTRVIVDALTSSKVTSVLCVGAPKIFLHLKNRKDSSRLSSLLLDIDERLSAFLEEGTEWCWYNMFNHYFFSGKSEYEAFLRGAVELAVVTDPPFGGKCELIAATLAAITDDWRKFGHHRKDIKIIWVFPYFMEDKVISSVPALKMLDYQVAYTNHKSLKRRKQGSPVRFFTNLAPSAFDLSACDGSYHFCAHCKMWVCAANRHCAECGACTSKNGAPYSHCAKCGRCVRDSWRHCTRCDRCALPDHPCDLFAKKRSRFFFSS